MSKLAHAGASSTTPSGFASANASCTALFERRRLVHRRRRRRARPARAARASPIATTARARFLSGSRSSRKSPPLNLPPMIGTSAGVEALDRVQRRVDVRRFRVVDEPHAADLGHELHRVLEAVKRIDRGRHRRRRGARDRADRRRRHHVVHQMRPEQVNRIERHELRRLRCRADRRSSRLRSPYPRRARSRIAKNRVPRAALARQRAAPPDRRR